MFIIGFICGAIAVALIFGVIFLLLLIAIGREKAPPRMPHGEDQELMTAAGDIPPGARPLLSEDGTHIIGYFHNDCVWKTPPTIKVPL